MNNIFAVAGVVIKELYRRKDFYVLFIVTIVICLVMASVNVFNDSQIIRYLKELCLLLIWVSSLVIAITTTARQIPAEREQRTLLPLLAKPLSRSQLIFGKFLGCWLACGLVLICFYVFFGALAASREHAWPLLNYFQAFWLQWMMLGVVTAMVLAGSIVFAAPSWDFGGVHFAGHGGLRPGDMFTTMLLAGPGVPRRRIEFARTVDLMPTLLKLLSRPMPADLDGRPLIADKPPAN